MSHHESAGSFRIMSLKFRIRDFFNPPKEIVKEAGIEPGYCVLDS